MSLYRQYRSSSFQELIGQDSVTTLLQNALAQGRLSHAYLFSGPRGTGKTSAARLLAKAATCLSPVTGKQGAHSTYEACGSCASCLSQQEGSTQDVIEIDAASNRSIEDIRELREQAAYPPLQLRYKIYIIDEAHMLTNEAFNALLKTLEEPAPQTLFILATTELHKVPATIKSRCQLVTFSSGSIASISGKLARIVKEEKWKAEPEALALIAEHARGGFRDAETTLEQLATQHQPLTAAIAAETLGITSQSAVTALWDAAWNHRPDQVRSNLEQLAAQPATRPEQLTLQLIALARLRGDDPKRLSAALSALLEAHILHRSTPLPFLPLEIALLTIASPTTEPALAQRVGIAPVVSEVHPRHEAVPVRPQTISIAPQSFKTSTSEVPVVELRDVAISDIRLAWKEMILDVGRTNPPLCQMLRETIFHSVEGATITVNVRFKFHAEKLAEKKNKARVEDILHHLTHAKWTVSYLVSDTMPRRVRNKEITGTAASDAAAVFGA
jgi:DNA polymerase III subunit gamma/tau